MEAIVDGFIILCRLSLKRRKEEDQRNESDAIGGGLFSGGRVVYLQRYFVFITGSDTQTVRIRRKVSVYFTPTNMYCGTQLLCTIHFFENM